MVMVDEGMVSMRSLLRVHIIATDGEQGLEWSPFGGGDGRRFAL